MGIPKYEPNPVTRKQEKVISVAFIPGDQCFVLAKESKLNTLNRLYHTNTMAVYPATVTAVTVNSDGTTYSLCVNTGIQTGGGHPFDVVYDWMTDVKGNVCFHSKEDAEAALKEVSL